jgi:hypothetical protein
MRRRMVVLIAAAMMAALVVVATASAAIFYNTWSPAGAFQETPGFAPRSGASITITDGNCNDELGEFLQIRYVNTSGQVVYDSGLDYGGGACGLSTGANSSYAKVQCRHGGGTFKYIRCENF